MRLALLFCSILALVSLRAEETPSPSPSPTVTPSPTEPPRSVLLRFALPPLEGTISLGIYDSSGKLVRVLHREDTLADFTAGHDAVETSWDGKNEAGNPLPNGKYRAGGFVVGDLRVEGVDYFFNDWVTDDHSPHVRRIWQLGMDPEGLSVTAELASGEKISFLCDLSTGAITKQIPLRLETHCDQKQAGPNLIAPVDCATGKNGTNWVIDAVDGVGPREVKQLAKDHEVLRRLSYAADEPQPDLIETSPSEEKIFLVEKNDRLQRFRALTLLRTTTENGDETVSDWETIFEKTIIAHQNFTLENGKPVAGPGGPQAARQKISQKLRSNPLQRDEPGKVELAVGIDEDGSYLQTADGLPLRTISDTPHLVRTLLARPDDETIDVFQDDGAVVEQFRLSNLTQMMAFDCGEFELK